MNHLLSALGLNAKEQKVWIKMLEIGAQPISIIARSVSIPRASMYFILEKLVALGVVTEFERFGIKYARCIPVREIEDLIRKQEHQVNQLRQLFSAEKSQLESLENQLAITPKFQIFEGQNAVEKMYRALLQNINQWWAYFNPELVAQRMPRYHTEIPKEIKRQRITAQELLIASSTADAYQAEFASKKHQIKVLPSSVLFASDTIITEERLYLISYGQDDLAAVEIWNKDLAQTQRTIFQHVWEHCG